MIRGHNLGAKGRALFEAEWARDLFNHASTRYPQQNNNQCAGIVSSSCGGCEAGGGGGFCCRSCLEVVKRTSTGESWSRSRSRSCFSHGAPQPTEEQSNSSWIDSVRS